MEAGGPKNIATGEIDSSNTIASGLEKCYIKDLGISWGTLPDSHLSVRNHPAYIRDRDSSRFRIITDNTVSTCASSAETGAQETIYATSGAGLVTSDDDHQNLPISVMQTMAIFTVSTKISAGCK